MKTIKEIIDIVKECFHLLTLFGKFTLFPFIILLALFLLFLTSFEVLGDITTKTGRFLFLKKDREFHA